VTQYAAHRFPHLIHVNNKVAVFLGQVA
jgi:hypothetical protein